MTDSNEKQESMTVDQVIQGVYGAIKAGMIPSDGAFSVMAKEIERLRAELAGCRDLAKILANPVLDSTSLIAEAEERFNQLKRKGFDRASFTSGYMEGRVVGWTGARKNRPPINPETGCYCDFAHHMTGDGCEICNPGYAADLAGAGDDLNSGVDLAAPGTRDRSELTR